MWNVSYIHSIYHLRSSFINLKKGEFKSCWFSYHRNCENPYFLNFYWKKRKKTKIEKKQQPNTTPKNDKRTLYIVMLKTVFLVHKCTWYIFLETEVFRPNICNTKNTLHAVHICLHCINTLWGKYSRPPESRADFVIRKYIVRWSKLVWKVYLFRI